MMLSGCSPTRESSGTAERSKRRSTTPAALSNWLQRSVHLAPFSGVFEPQSIRDGNLESITLESTAMAKSLKGRGFRFVGPTTSYAFMQAMGIVNDHLPGCAAGDEADIARAKFVRPLPV